NRDDHPPCRSPCTSASHRNRRICRTSARRIHRSEVMNRSQIPAWLDRHAYPFEHRWFTLGSGARVHYVDEGTGPTLLFVHGTPTWSFEWREQIKALAPSFRCVALDLVGMGLSDRPADFAYTPEAHAAALSEFVNGLDLQDFTLIVHDFGGPIGLPLA